MGRQNKGSRAFLWVRLKDLAFKNNRPISAEIITDIQSEISDISDKRLLF